jgi:peptide/nickel transport system substrate-binding protein
MGTGPFQMSEWKKGESIRLTRNPHYWEDGLPLLDEVLISVVPDDNARILQLQGGDLDAIYNVPSSRIAELRSTDGLQVIEFPSTFTVFIALNVREAPLNDVHARLALQYATDRKTLIDVVLFGAGTEATTLLPKGALYFNDQLPGFPYDLDRAKSELAQSATPDGFGFELIYLAGDTEVDQLAAALKDMWSQIGVDLTINPVEQGIFVDAYDNGTYQALYTNWTNDIIDPDELVAYGVLPESSEAFHTGWMNEEAIALGREGAAELDPATRKEIYFRIQEIFNADSPMLPLYYKPFVDALTTKIHNYLHLPTGQWDWKRTWIEQ